MAVVPYHAFSYRGKVKMFVHIVSKVFVWIGGKNPGTFGVQNRILQCIDTGLFKPHKTATVPGKSGRIGSVIMPQYCISYRCKYHRENLRCHLLHSCCTLSGRSKIAKQRYGQQTYRGLSFFFSSYFVICDSSFPLKWTLSYKFLSFCRHYLVYSNVLCNISIADIIFWF